MVSEGETGALYDKNRMLWTFGLFLILLHIRIEALQHFESHLISQFSEKLNEINGFDLCGWREHDLCVNAFTINEGGRWKAATIRCHLPIFCFEFIMNLLCFNCQKHDQR